MTAARYPAPSTDAADVLAPEPPGELDEIDVEPETTTRWESRIESTGDRDLADRSHFLEKGFQQRVLLPGWLISQFDHPGQPGRTIRHFPGTARPAADRLRCQESGVHQGPDMVQHRGRMLAQSSGDLLIGQRL